MPGVTAGVYEGSLEAGTEVSSTYEGRHVTVYEAELTHPYHADGFVDKGDPVVLIDSGVPATYGVAVGVAFNSAAAVTDLIALDTEGIWNLTVYAEGDDGNLAIEIGDRLYIRAGDLPGAADADGTGDAEISRITDSDTQIPFGYALGSVVAGGSGVIAVKVHFGDITVGNDAIDGDKIADDAVDKEHLADEIYAIEHFWFSTEGSANQTVYISRLWSAGTVVRVVYFTDQALGTSLGLDVIDGGTDGNGTDVIDSCDDDLNGLDSNDLTTPYALSANDYIGIILDDVTASTLITIDVQVKVPLGSAT